MPSFQSADAQINYQTFGDPSSPALVFSTLWAPIMVCGKNSLMIKRSIFVICYDTRGHGLSSTPNGPYTVEQLGEDVVRLLDHLNINKAAFVVFQWVVLTGQWLAIHYPNRFSHIIVANTAAKIGQEQAACDRAKCST